MTLPPLCATMALMTFKSQTFSPLSSTPHHHQMKPGSPLETPEGGCWLQIRDSRGDENIKHFYSTVSPQK